MSTYHELPPDARAKRAGDLLEDWSSDEEDAAVAGNRAGYSSEEEEEDYSSEYSESDSDDLMESSDEEEERKRGHGRGHGKGHGRGHGYGYGKASEKKSGGKKEGGDHLVVISKRTYEKKPRDAIPYEKKEMSPDPRRPVEDFASATVEAAADFAGDAVRTVEKVGRDTLGLFDDVGQATKDLVRPAGAPLRPVGRREQPAKKTYVGRVLTHARGGAQAKSAPAPKASTPAPNSRVVNVTGTIAEYGGAPMEVRVPFHLEASAQDMENKSEHQIVTGAMMKRAIERHMLTHHGDALFSKPGETPVALQHVDRSVLTEVHVNGLHTNTPYPVGVRIAGYPEHNVIVHHSTGQGYAATTDFNKGTSPSQRPALANMLKVRAAPNTGATLMNAPGGWKYEDVTHNARGESVNIGSLTAGSALHQFAEVCPEYKKWAEKRGSAIAKTQDGKITQVPEHVARAVAAHIDRQTSPMKRPAVSRDGIRLTLHRLSEKPGGGSAFAWRQEGDDWASNEDAKIRLGGHFVFRYTPVKRIVASDAIPVPKGGDQ